MPLELKHKQKQFKSLLEFRMWKLT